MIILSFDIGIKNLAYCKFDTEHNHIDEWGIINLVADNELCKSVRLSDMCDRLIMALDDAFDANNPIDLVLLENQPVLKNPVMKSIQMMLFTYFMLRKVHDSTVSEVILVSARRKTAVFTLSDEVEQRISMLKSPYAQTKLRGKEITRELIQQHKVTLSEQASTSYEKSKKKDDMADAFLQAWTHLRSK